MALQGQPKILFLDEQSAGVDPAARRKQWKVMKELSQESTLVVTTHAMEEAEALATTVGIMVAGKLKCIGTVQHLKEKFGKGYELEFKLAQQIESLLNDSDPTQVLNSHQEVRDFIRHHIEEDVNTIYNPTGDFKQFYDSIEAMNEVYEKTLLQAIMFIKETQAIIDKLESDFSEVIVLDQTIDYIHLRLSRDDKSVGFLFGYVEQLKNEFNIGEYSVSETTLEQIFNTFAKEEEAQRRRSTRRRIT